MKTNFLCVSAVLFLICFANIAQGQILPTISLTTITGGSFILSINATNTAAENGTLACVASTTRSITTAAELQTLLTNLPSVLPPSDISVSQIPTNPFIYAISFVPLLRDGRRTLLTLTSINIIPQTQYTIRCIIGASAVFNQTFFSATSLIAFSGNNQLFQQTATTTSIYLIITNILNFNLFSLIIFKFNSNIFFN